MALPGTIIVIFTYVYHTHANFHTTRHASIERGRVIGVLNNTLVTSCHVICQKMLTCTEIAVTSLDEGQERTSCYLLSDEVTGGKRDATTSTANAYILKELGDETKTTKMEDGEEKSPRRSIECTPQLKFKPSPTSTLRLTLCKKAEAEAMESFLKTLDLYTGSEISHH